jgi:hypothetical protein
MAHVLYQCPRTSMKVQAWVAEAANAEKARGFEIVTCPACTQLHFINRSTGRLLGDAAK